MDNTEQAADYFKLAVKACERGDTRDALAYGERAQDLLLREPPKPIEIDLKLGELARA